jgi:uncharacterized protein (TIGR03000 family)
MRGYGVVVRTGALALLVAGVTVHPALVSAQEKAGGFGRGMGSGQTGWGYFDPRRSNSPSVPGYTPPVSPGTSVPALPYTGSFVSPEELAAARRFAVVEVRLPAADAQLWFDDVLTRKRGPDRVFQTPPLEPDRSFYYIVRARWMENGRGVEQTRKVSVRAGRRSVLDFTRPPDSPSAQDSSRSPTPPEAQNPRRPATSR